MENDIMNSGRLAEISEHMWLIRLVAFIVIFVVVKYTLDRALKQRN